MHEKSGGNYIGIDYGERRIGLAKSDPTGLIASALTTLEVCSMREAVAKVGEIIEEFKPDGLVVGYPLHASGDRTDKCREIDLFINELATQFHGRIHRMDESHSSQEAADIIHAHGKRIGKNKKMVDRLAAVIILQRFLDETPNVTRDDWLT